MKLITTIAQLLLIPVILAEGDKAPEVKIVNDKLNEFTDGEELEEK